MKEIFEYFMESNIKGILISDHMGERFEFKIYDCEVRIGYKTGMTVAELKEQVNNQYLKYLKNQADLHKSMFESFEKQIKDYNPILK